MTMEREWKAFQKALPKLLKTASNRGKYALIHGDRVIDVWPTMEEALEQGYNFFYLEPFLVQEIVETETVRFFPRNVKRS